MTWENQGGRQLLTPPLPWHAVNSVLPSFLSLIIDIGQDGAPHEPASDHKTHGNRNVSQLNLNNYGLDDISLLSELPDMEMLVLRLVG